MTTIQKRQDIKIFLFCLFGVLLFFGTLAVCSKKYKTFCAEPTEVIAITSNSYRTTYVKLSNGETVGLYTPTIAPGDTFCFKYETIEVDPKPYRLLGK